MLKHGDARNSPNRNIYAIQYDCLNSMLRAFKYRLYPNETQKRILSNQFGSCRFVWNHFLDLRNERYAETGKGMTYKQMAALLKKMKEKKDYEWMNEVNSQSLQQSLMHLETAFNRFFKNLGDYPIFKRRSNRQSFTVPQHFSVEGNVLYTPKIEDGIRMFKHRDFDGQMRSVTISLTPSGRYYASILVSSDETATEEKPISSETTVGIDVGLESFAVLSDGIQVDGIRSLRSSENKLARAQRILSRKEKGSRNRNKQRRKVARIHEHISNQRMDFQQKLSDVLTRAYDTIAIEDLNVNGMVKNHKLAKAIEDAGWSSFITMLKTKASQRGKNVVEIGRFDPSSKMCSRCGSVREMKLSDRTYRCEKCGLTINRDLNASLNIKKFGLIKTGVPADSGEFTPVDRSANTLSLLAREGIVQARWLNQEAPRFG